MMKPFKIILAPFLALIFAGHVYLHSVNIHPERATGIVGGEVQINCVVEFGPSDEMTWDSNTEFVYIITGDVEKYPQGTSKYSVNRTGMNFALKVKDLSLEDGGEYMCTSFTSEATAILVVLDTPSITLNPTAPVDGETAKVTCEARFGGPKEDLILPGHYPYLKMYLNNSPLNDMVTANDPSDDKKQYLISMTKNVTLSARMNTRNITCEIGTDEPSMKHSGVALLNVLYSVRDIIISPDQEKYKVGDTISCNVDGNPAAVYEWKEVQGGATINGKWMNITESTIGENQWECVAKNVINGEWFEKRKQITFLTVDPSKSGNDSSAVTIGVVTVIIAILVVIAAVAFFFRKKMRKPKGSCTNVNANNLQELESVEAENRLQNIPLLKDSSGAFEHSVTVRNQGQKSDETKLSKPTIPQGGDGSGASEYSNQGNIQDQKSDVTEPALPKHIPQETDGSSSSKISLRVKTQEQHSDVTKPLQFRNQGQKSDETKLSKVEKPKARKLGSRECIERLRTVKNKQELDKNGEEILRVLQQKDELANVENYQMVLNYLLLNASELIDSEYYEDIIKMLPHGSDVSPLKCLLLVMKTEDGLKKFLENQNKLLSVIKIISSYGDVQYRTECLEYIIITRTFSDREYRFEWSEEYLSLLKDLLENGADPTWIPPEELKLERKDRSTAQTELFLKIFLNLWENNELYESLLQVLPLMMSKKCTNTELLRGTILHDFVASHWNYIATSRKSMPSNFFRQFKNILREILRHDETLVGLKDWYGRTPLQWFLIDIQLDESILSDVREIIQMLQSPEVLSAKDEDGQNALNILVTAFPLIQGQITQQGMESLLELFKSFASESNVGCQDAVLHQTALHHLVNKFPAKISEQSGEVFLNFIKHLATYNILEKKNINGFTALHILTHNFTFNIPQCAMETFVEVIKCIAVPSNICIQDPSGCTALEIIHKKCDNCVPEQCKDTYQEILYILSGK